MGEAGYYTVQRGDTLGKIAWRAGTTSTELAKINGLANPNRIEEGQKLALTREAVCKVGFQFLDRDRNPIRNAKVRLEFCGNVIDTTSGEGGRTRDIITDSPLDTVKVWIARYDGNWKLITEVLSDWGNKLVTLTSPKIRVEASTHPHPQDSHGQPLKDKPRPPLPPTPEIPRETTAQGKPQSTFGDGKGTKIEEIQDGQGLPVARATSDQAGLDFLQGYTGEKITEADYEAAAKEVGCDIAAIKAVAEIESKGEGFLGNRPKILYERHKFSKWTKQRFDMANPDISWPVSYITKKQSKQATPNIKKKISKFVEKKVHDYDFYGNSYVRFARAYRLDQKAAIKACSWGKFQILGENYAETGQPDIMSFFKMMCISEREHLRAFVAFIKADNVKLTAIRANDWATFARRYNGPDYKDNEYDTKMASAYSRFKRR